MSSRQLAELQYQRNDVDFARGTYRVRGDVIDVFPAEAEAEAVRIELFDEEVESISLFDPLTGAAAELKTRCFATAVEATNRGIADIGTETKAESAPTEESLPVYDILGHSDRPLANAPPSPLDAEQVS